MAKKKAKKQNNDLEIIIIEVEVLPEIGEPLTWFLFEGNYYWYNDESGEWENVGKKRPTQHPPR